MRHLSSRMNTGVGAAGAMHRRSLAAEAEDRALYRVLHGWAVLLPLPAHERPAVVLDDQAPAGHEVPLMGARRQERSLPATDW